MNEKYSNAYIDSVTQYLYNLKYLARQNPETLKDLSLLEIFTQVYNWSDWFEVSEADKIHIQKLMDCIFLRNSDLILPTVVPGIFYSNVSTPQTIWTWQRIWDNIDSDTTVGPSTLYTLSATPTSFAVPATQTTKIITVSSNTTWTAVSNQPWCTISNISGNVITLLIPLNILAGSRNATITISGTVAGQVTPVVISIVQEGAAATLTVLPATRTVSALAGTTSYEVTTNGSWTASSDSAWCVVTASGTGNSTMIATFSQNLSGGSRTAYIRVTTPGLTPIQVQLVQEYSANYLTVTPATRTVSKTATSTTFEVSSNVNWTTSVLSSTTDWITVVSSGSNNATVTVTFGQNTALTPRTAAITFAATGVPSVTVQLTQGAEDATFSVTPTTFSLPYTAGTTGATITSNAPWVLYTDAHWLTIPSSGNGNASFAIDYAMNNLTSSRVGHIVVSVTGQAPIVITLTQAAFSGSIIPKLPIQGFIYTWPTLFDSRKLTSSDEWLVATADNSYLSLKNAVAPDYDNLLIDSDTLGFAAVSTFGRTADGAFYSSDPNIGSKTFSPYTTSTTGSPQVVTFIGLREVGETTIPVMETLAVSSNSSYPVRLVKKTTTLAAGESGTYVGNNGLEYYTIAIQTNEGVKEWLTGNLLETSYRNGDSIPEITLASEWSEAINQLRGARCSYLNDENNAYTSALP